MTITDQIFQAIKQAGQGGISIANIADKIGVDQRRIQYLAKSMVDRCKIKRLNPPKARPQLFVIATGKKIQLDRTRDVAAITKAQARNTTVSPQRIQIEKLLKNAHQAMRVVTIADKTGIDKNQVRKIMARLAHDGVATNVGTSKETIWRATRKIKAAQESAHSKSISYHCNGTMGHAKPGDIPRMECVR